ncbi:MAG TPA: MGMT family protein [Kouleothrix sp.]|nr:MGMT family protein [Kouleothrix sp.]
MAEGANYALYEKIYLVCEHIPPGMVATYGDIATIVGGGCDARTVGFALNEMPPEHAHLPWQRIINRQGGISTRGLAQRQLLEAEGVAFDAHDRVIMARYHWAGPSAEWAAAHGFNTLPPRNEGDRAEQLSLF